MVESKDLQKMSLFRELTEKEIGEIKRLIFEKTYRKGTILFFEGMPGGIMYLVKSGQIEIFKKQGLEELHLATLGPGDFVGEMSLIDDEPRSAGGRVVEDSVLWVITKKCFEDMMAASPVGVNKILLVFLRILSQRLRAANRKMTSN